MKMWSKSMRLKNIALKGGEPPVDLMTNIVSCYFRNGESLAKGGNVLHNGVTFEASTLDERFIRVKIPRNNFFIEESVQHPADGGVESRGRLVESRAYALGSALFKVESEGRSILPAPEEAPEEAPKVQTVGIFARRRDTPPAESHDVFSRVETRRWRAYKKRPRWWCAGCKAENGQKKRGCVTDNTTLSRLVRPTLLSVTLAISPRPPVNEVHRRQREPTSGSARLFFPANAATKDFLFSPFFFFSLSFFPSSNATLLQEGGRESAPLVLKVHSYGVVNRPSIAIRARVRSSSKFTCFVCSSRRFVVEDGLASCFGRAGCVMGFGKKFVIDIGVSEVGELWSKLQTKNYFCK
ncbi:hypothetical protein K0M31_010369 [Melipona bicolor]|uniref:Uncharacterized protein n=1 Tax=Melipona bicolor TaxID=60889 RepID=A0AA40FMU5_9HYME|nr:hypothetical protein K0M31_010369 [Melipona bicolor]